MFLLALGIQGGRGEPGPTGDSGLSVSIKSQKIISLNFRVGGTNP